MEDIDIWRAAHQFIKMHGEDAAVRAAMRADELLSAGDAEGFHVWQRVTAAINELERDKPSASEPLN
jgi:hypothetical protein